MVAKTYADLSAAPDVADGDLLASYRGTGPLKQLTAAQLKNYMGASFVPVSSLASSSGSSLVGFLQGGTGAVARTAQTKMRAQVSVEDFGAVANNSSFDSTAAVQAAITYVASQGGGEVVFENGTYYANVVVTGINVWLVGKGNRAAFNANVIQPWNQASPPLTIGDNTTLTRNCGMRHLGLSGVKRNCPPADTALTANNAPATIRFKGNTAIFEAQFCSFYNGKKTIELAPSLADSTPVTGIKFWGGEIRNDITDDTNATAIWADYPSTDAYATDLQWYGCKINGAPGGWTAWASNGAILELKGTYCDMPGCLLGVVGGLGIGGFKLRTGGTILSDDATFDPLGLDKIIIDTDYTGSDINRVMQGRTRKGRQLWRNGSGVNRELPDQADLIGYKAGFTEPHVKFPMYFATAADGLYSLTGGYFNTDTDAGPLSLFDIGLRLRVTTQSTSTTTGSFVSAGGAGFAKAIHSGEDFNAGSGTGAVTGYGAGRIDTGGNLRVLPGGALQVGGASVQPDGGSPNITLGAAGSSFVRAYVDQVTVGSNATTSPTIYSGSGAPNGVVSAAVGSIYLNAAGGAATTLYVKESGAGTNTGWVAK